LGSARANGPLSSQIPSWIKRDFEGILMDYGYV
jgi:hypothetical protein